MGVLPAVSKVTDLSESGLPLNNTRYYLTPAGVAPASASGLFQ
jgi:hypothetical protein